MATVRARVKMLSFRRGVETSVDLVTFEGLSEPKEHFALIVEPIGDIPIVRVHSECATGDIFGSARCDCGDQLTYALGLIQTGGILIYLRQEGRGIGLYEKIDAYVLQDANMDTYEANRSLGRADDERSFVCAIEILVALGVERVRLITGNPDKVDELVKGGIDVVRRISAGWFPTVANTQYLAAKHVLKHHDYGDVGNPLLKEAFQSG